MPAIYSYDYTIVRVVPRVDREEFLNAGVILSCAETSFLEAKIHLDEACLQAMSPTVDLALVQKHLRSIPLICEGGPHSGPIGALDQRPKFHWLTAIRSSMIQTSPPHSGQTKNPATTLEHLFARHVAR